MRLMDVEAPQGVRSLGHRCVVRDDGTVREVWLNCSEKGASSSLKRDPVAEPLYAVDSSSEGGLAVSLVKVVAAQLLIGGAVAKHVVDDDQDSVGQGDGGAFCATASSQPVVLG